MISIYIPTKAELFESETRIVPRLQQLDMIAIRVPYSKALY